MTHARLVCAGIASWLLVSGCHKPEPTADLQTQPDPTADLPTYSLHVANRLTGEPVVGARIRPYCGIPGDTNIWRTDFQGLVKFRSWFAGGGTLVTVSASGYIFTNFSVPLTNRVTTVLLDKTP